MSTLSLLALPTTTVGVEVTVRVMTSPETVVSMMLVTGVADGVVCGLLVLVVLGLADVDVDDVRGGCAKMKGQQMPVSRSGDEIRLGRMNCVMRSATHTGWLVGMAWLV